MTEARVVYYEKEGRDLVSINAADPIRPSFALSKDLDKALLLSTLAESLETFVSESDPAEPFYRLARHAMDALFAGAPAALAAAYFDVWILRLSGLFPSPRECAGCGRLLEDARSAPLRRVTPRLRRRRMPPRGSPAPDSRRAADALHVSLRPARPRVPPEGPERDQPRRAPRAPALPRARAEIAAGARRGSGLEGAKVVGFDSYGSPNVLTRNAAIWPRLTGLSGQ